MKYVTISGDTWDVIALKELGSEKFASQLIEANLNHVSTIVFESGIELKIPVITEQPSSNLPPWKRGVSSAS